MRYQVTLVMEGFMREKRSDIKKRLRIAQLRKQRNRCFWCQKVLHGKADMTLDYLVPKSWGGKLVSDNIVVACRDCNSQKADNIFFLRD